MTDTSTKTKRPHSVGIICAIGLLWALLSIPLVFQPELHQQYGAWYPPYLAFTIAVALVCIVGLWFMQKWAVYAYAVFAVIDQVVRIVTGNWNIVYLLAPAVLIYFAWIDVVRGKNTTS